MKTHRRRTVNTGVFFHEERNLFYLSCNVDILTRNVLLVPRVDYFGKMNVIHSIRTDIKDKHPIRL